jgi:hypothetical protein
MIYLARPWFPIALGLCVAGSFALWYSMTDYERARYFAIIAGIPVTVFAFLGLLGIKGE